jgi:glycine/D-amino acid oxidase-like deaminating enzyme
MTGRAVDPLAALDLRVLWQAQLPPQPDRSGRPLPDAADLVVVGGGFTGLAAARRGALLGARVVLLEAETLGWGASSRNAGMCLVGHKWGPRELAAHFGPELGSALQRETVESVEWTAATIAAEGIDAGLERAGHLELAFAPADAEGMEVAARELTESGTPARFVARAELRTETGTDAYFGGLLVEPDGGLDPARYHAGLAGAAARAGADLHERVRALRIRPQRDGRMVVETSRGAILAREVFVGTNGYTSGVAPFLRRRVIPVGSYIVATDPLPEDLAAEISPRGRMFFDTKHFLNYWRLTPDRRLLFGGRVSFWPSSVGSMARALQRAMVAVHPQLAGIRVAHAWGGKLGFTADRMPHAGRSTGVSYAIGCSGSGVAMLPYLGDRTIAWVLAGEEAPALARLPFPLVPAPYEGRAWFMPVVGEWYRLQDRRAARTRS